MAGKGGKIKDTLCTVHRIKGRPGSVVAGTVFLHGSLLSIYIKRVAQAGCPSSSFFFNTYHSFMKVTHYSD